MHQRTAALSFVIKAKGQRQNVVGRFVDPAGGKSLHWEFLISLGRMGECVHGEGGGNDGRLRVSGRFEESRKVKQPLTREVEPLPGPPWRCCQALLRAPPGGDDNKLMERGAALCSLPR